MISSRNIKMKFSSFAMISILTACAGIEPQAPTREPDPVTVAFEPASDLKTIPGLEYRGMKIENAAFDLPVEMNPAVEKWIAYFTGKGRGHFKKYLERSEYFIPFLKPILKNAKAPEDLVYLAMIESGFNNNARSNARAVGAWQFISATGRRYGLDVNWWVDERRDVEKSTIAAVQYLKELHTMFGSWHLAAAGYNAGEAKIQRAIAKYKTNDFWELCDRKRRYLRPETKNYVPKLFAAAIVAKNRKQFGFEESYTKIGDVNAALVSVKAEESDDLERLPDQLDSDKPEPNANNGIPSEPIVELTRDSPVDPEEAETLASDSMETMLRSMSQPVRTPHVNRHGEVNGDVLTEVEIPSPADLFKVASAAGLTYVEFKSMNPELSRWVTPPDVKYYKIRLPLSHKEAFMKKYFDPSFSREVTFLVYKARRGDTPKRVSKRFGISPDPILDMNDVKSPNSSFMPGAMIELPIPSDFVRSIASLKTLELLDPVYPKRHRYRRFKRRKSRSASSSEVRFDGSSRRSRM
ncbi:MAG: transglycosylase SLT domain-containing protein [Bdellovibrionales bacterium]|nr:transglycosylase SLT domain-containing protein [Bdellovibrionales bacterium]